MVLEQIKLEWLDVCNLVDSIHEQTQDSDNKNIGVIGISRGGLIPAVLLSHKKTNSTVFSVGVKSYQGTNRAGDTIYQIPDMEQLQKLDTIYLIDDICDTGLTFKNLLNKTFKNLPVQTVSLLYRKNSIYVPNVFGQVILDENWRVFPWEKE